MIYICLLFFLYTRVECMYNACDCFRFRKRIMSDLTNQALAVIAERLQDINLSMTERATVVKKFCDVWQNNMQSSSYDELPKKPTKEDNWKLLKADCIKADIAFYKAADRLTELKKRVIDHENESGCTPETREWIIYLCDHKPAMTAYEERIKLSAEMRERSKEE